MSTTTALTPAAGRFRSNFADGINAFAEAERSFKSRRKAAAAARRRLKKAEFEANDSQFENAFASIAFTYLKERAPGLIENLVGFQLLDKSDENQKACGVFVCQVGKRIIDIPMFFIKGELKGYQVMRIRNPELFLVLREGFLDYILAQMTQDSGELGPPRGTSDVNRSSPNIELFAGQRYFKNGSEEKFSYDRSHIADWANELDVPNEYHRMRHDLKSLKLAQALLDKNHQYVDIPAMLKEYDPLLKSAHELAEDYPQFDRLMTKVAGENWREIKPEQKKTASSFDPPQIVKQHELKLRLGETKQAGDQAIAGTVSVTGKSELHHLTKFAQATGHSTEELVQEADRFGEVIYDNRDRSKLAEAYVIDEGYQSYQVTSPELVEVMTPDAGFKELLVIPAKHCYSSPQYDLILDTKGGKWTYATPSAYVARRVEGRALHDEKAAMDKAIAGKTSKPKPGELFFVVDQQNHIYGPYLCEEKIGPREFVVHDCSRRHISRGEHFGRSLGGNYPADSPYQDVSKLIYSRNNYKVDISGVDYEQDLVVPEKSKIIVIKNLGTPERQANQPASGDESRCDWYSYSRAQRDSTELRVTDMNTFMRDMIFNRTNMKLAATADGFYKLNSETCKAGKARRVLMSHYELSKESAEQLLSEATRETKSFIVAKPEFISGESDKLAYYYPTFDEPSFNQPYPSESGRFQVNSPETYEVETRDELPQKEELLPWEDPDEEDFMASQEDYQNLLSGDESDIMNDMAGFISLLRNARIDTSLRKLTKSILNTIDQLGRQIFIFYAHIGEFEEMFGDNEVGDIESSLITVFEGLGDLFISLIRRSDDPTPELDIADLPVS